ncbi:follistatin isoform X5 [Solenopsis invicta]|uniref:follistatin isoform X5 n=1 Tax=Solenopsis invicta TaxID=13686 RepID=UPI00193E0E87|nr:follistatin isoform X5 [Solenopsis invicta]
MKCKEQSRYVTDLTRTKAEVKKAEVGFTAGIAARRKSTWRGPSEMTTLRKDITVSPYKTFFLVSLIGLLLQIHSTTGGICWSSISNGRCKELLSQGTTKENCCASNAAAATAYSDEDLDSGSLFFWRVLGGGVQCHPCRESCTEVRCEEGKKCVVRKGRPRCVCSPECKAPRGGGGPVCGTDGKSYKSLCRLKKRACKKSSHELAVAYNGHCQSEFVRTGSVRPRSELFAGSKSKPSLCEVHTQLPSNTSASSRKLTPRLRSRRKHLQECLPPATRRLSRRSSHSCCL